LCDPLSSVTQGVETERALASQSGAAPPCSQLTAPAYSELDMADVELLYRQHLTARDLDFLQSESGTGGSVLETLSSPLVEAALFATNEHHVMEAGLSPFLVFAVAVHRTHEQLVTASYVEERWAPRVRIPLFDVAALRLLLSDTFRRYFLVELLASYTRVASGVTWTRTARGWRRRRFTELDPASLAEQLEAVAPAERTGVYRRLGDLALFQLGVFPDHAPLMSGPARDRILRVSGVRSEEGDFDDGQALLAMLGSRWYRAAAYSANQHGQPRTWSLDAAAYMGEHFSEARRVLNAVTDRFLFPLREQWFGR
jgi:hypothetical protein